MIAYGGYGGRLQEIWIAGECDFMARQFNPLHCVRRAMPKTDSDGLCSRGAVGVQASVAGVVKRSSCNMRTREWVLSLS